MTSGFEWNEGGNVAVQRLGQDRDQSDYLSATGSLGSGDLWWVGPRLMSPGKVRPTPRCSLC